MAGENKWRKTGQGFRAEGIAMAIPMIMVVFPVGGAFLGHWAGKYFERPWLVFVGLGLGLFLGTREVIRLVKELKVVQSDNDKGK